MLDAGDSISLHQYIDVLDRLGVRVELAVEDDGQMPESKRPLRDYHLLAQRRTTQRTLDSIFTAAERAHPAAADGRAAWLARRQPSTAPTGADLRPWLYGYHCARIDNYRVKRGPLPCCESQSV
jgi:hypothetical protein